MTKIQANDTPDIAFIPQPGVVANIVKRNKAIALDDVVDMSTLKSSMLPGALEAGTVDGKLYGLLSSANVKSLVFYNKKAWDKAGYKAPTSIDELDALTEQIKADGGVAVVHGHRGRHRHRLAGHRLVRGAGHEVRRRRRATTSGSPTRSRSTPTWSSRPARSSRSWSSPTATTSATARRSPAPTSVTPRTRCATGRPGLLAVQAGLVHHGVLPRGRGEELRPPTSASSASRRPTAGENPVLGGGDLAVLLNDSDGGQDRR